MEMTTTGQHEVRLATLHWVSNDQESSSRINGMIKMFKNDARPSKLTFENCTSCNTKNVDMNQAFKWKRTETGNHLLINLEVNP